MIGALENFAPRWFTPPGQDGDKLTRFKIKPLDGEEYSQVAQYMSLVDGKIHCNADGGRIAIELGLVDWENFEGSSGPIAFDRVNFKKIPFVTRQQIISEIILISNLTEEQEKN